MTSTLDTLATIFQGDIVTKGSVRPARSSRLPPSRASSSRCATDPSLAPRCTLSPATLQPGYAAAIHRYFKNAEKPARVVLYPTSTDDIARALAFARAEGLPLVVAGGGRAHYEPFLLRPWD
jgi:hypothetical protein